MSRQVLRTEIVSDNVTLYTVRGDDGNVSQVTYEHVCSLCNITEDSESRSDALESARAHECEMGDDD